MRTGFKYLILSAPGIISVATIAISLGFARFTGHMWEDYLITFRSSLNLATGNGLVFQPGERVHSFTSPLGTLLPAFFALMGGENVELRSLWGLRVVSALSLGGALWMTLRTLQRDGLVPMAIAAASVALVLDPKIVDFAMNGMETGLLVFFVVLTWYGFVCEARAGPCILGCAGLQWTRPDGCIFFAAIALGWALFGANVAGNSWRKRILHILRIVVIAGAFYLPWFVLAWSYYGSPVPHTILAKVQSRAAGETFSLLLSYPWQLVLGTTNLHDVFNPAYFFIGGWPPSVEWLSRILATGAALAWVWPRVLPAGRIASCAFFLGGFYVAYIPPFPWYYPGWQMLGWLTWAFLLHAFWGVTPAFHSAMTLPKSLVRIAAATIVGLQLLLFIGVAWQMRIQQSVIEDNHRAEIGRWLARNASPEDTVFLECLGYIGYYSKLKMLDFPGLSAPEVVAARKAGHRSYGQVIDVLKPNWVVLRPGEGVRVFAEVPTLRNEYTLAREFNARHKVDAFKFLPGRGYLNLDAVFLVYQRRPPPERKA